MSTIHTRTSLPPAHHRPRYRLTRRGKVVFTLLPLLMLALLASATTSTPRLELVGPEPGALLGSDNLPVRYIIVTDADPRSVSATLGEEPVEVVEVARGRLEVSLEPVDGNHRLTVTVNRGFPFSAVRRAVDLTVDTTPPALAVLAPTAPVPVGSPVTVTVTVDDPEAEVAFDGEAVAIADDGTVSRLFEAPPRTGISIVAVDPAGNRSELEVFLELALPGAPGAPPMFGVHASGYTWATPVLRDPILAAIAAGQINTVQLDLKDEGGEVWYDTGVELAHEMGAVTVLWDLEEVVAELHELGVRVVGRIVCFRDPIMARYAERTGRMAWVIQNPDGTAYGQYGGFTNLFDPDVRAYNMALAEEAARLGVDDIMYDYVRRPDTLRPLVYPGQEGTPSDGIVSFLEETRARLEPLGARLGAAVFGIAATRPDEIAQDIPRIAEIVDYVAPMVYPSHWGPGEYGVAHPNAQPYDITYRSLLDFQRITEGKRAHVVSWLQDFSLGISYGEAEVRAQIRASRDAGVDNILLWDPATTYTWAALDPLD